MSENPYSSPQAPVADPQSFEAPSRPVLVWIICILTWLGLLFGVLGLWLLATHRVPFPPEQAGFYDKLNIVDYGLTAVGLGLALVSSVSLFLLRKIAVPLYAAGLGLGVLQLLWQIAARDWLTMMSAGGVGSVVGAVFGWGVSIAIFAYVWYLGNKGTLR